MPRVHRYFKELRLRQLRAIVELARRGSFAEVARALDPSVASVWQQIRGMEKEFGVPLVQVVGRRWRSTFVRACRPSHSSGCNRAKLMWRSRATCMMPERWRRR